MTRLVIPKGSLTAASANPEPDFGTTMRIVPLAATTSSGTAETVVVGTPATAPPVVEPSGVKRFFETIRAYAADEEPAF